ncbi:MAG: sodium-translocating pyrophosphatase [Dehalococcoidia bacterium]|nr:sodium-translocating pyrophosphatase [Dehalococcoidia bacterium]|tara:strand:+ start:4843 stop:6906 length:2064 start_codon:yes stop_codon:yes gene_type:complete
MDNLILIVLISAGIALLSAIYFFWSVVKRKVENKELAEIAGLIQEGSYAFLKKEYTILSFFVLAMFVVLWLVVDLNIFNASGFNENSGPWTAISYLAGAIGSSIAGIVGMNIAVRGNSRTAEAAEGGLNQALRVAFNTGSVMGLTVVGVGLLGVTLLWVIFDQIAGAASATNIIAGFGFGASSIALFARVGGGIYTKAADVGADLVGKVEAGIPEDDPRNPATIADNVGDNVGDVAGMGADLFESYAGSLIATISLAILVGVDNVSTTSLVMLPLIISAIGIIASIIGTFLVRTKPDASMNSLLWSFRIGIFGAAILALAGIYLANSLLFNDPLPTSLFFVVLTGLAVGQVIGTATEYFTSYEYFPVKWISKQSLTGHPSNIIAGISVGLYSTAIPALSIVVGILIAFNLAGLYGVGLAAVGMLSTLGITLSTDAYGPVADNAGGLAEQAGLKPEVRERTDALDALGNTTAATGKGFAIGSAILTALALLAAYGLVTGVTTINIMDPKVLSGVLIGALLPFLFSGMTMQAVGTAAGAMIEEVRRQFREIKGLKEGKKGVKPDAARAVAISTAGSLKAMILPSILAIISPILVGLLLKAEALGGMLAGSIVSGFLLAIFMANSGGAWDNAKKYVELGNHGGKGSDTHKAAVTGDTVGDPFKDTSGPSINILLKLMTIVALVFGPLFIG